MQQNRRKIRCDRHSYIPPETGRPGYRFGCAKTVRGAGKTRLRENPGVLAGRHALGAVRNPAVGNQICILRLAAHYLAQADFILRYGLDRERIRSLLYAGMAGRAEICRPGNRGHRGIHLQQLLYGLSAHPVCRTAHAQHALRDPRRCQIQKGHPVYPLYPDLYFRRCAETPGRGSLVP